MKIRMPKTKGFTLVEILAALSILALGLSAVVALLFGSIRHGRLSSNRNAAMILIPEAVRQIELEHLITSDTVGIPANDPGIGRFVETLDNSPTNPGEGDEFAPYANITVGSMGEPPVGGNIYLSPFVKNTKEAKNFKNLSMWPHIPDNPRKIGGASYRVIYRLEKHPDWWPHEPNGNYVAAKERVGDPMRGMYLLTLACYHAPDNKVENWTQVSDPMQVLLRDRRNR